MKINVEIECTPIEARQFFGLPNVEPIQTSVMAQMEKRILDEMERFSPDALLKSWFAFSPIDPEQLQKFFGNIGRNVPPRA
jgi:hypothetical protein